MFYKKLGVTVIFISFTSVVGYFSNKTAKEIYNARMQCNPKLKNDYYKDS
jgi:hypothetical protein